MNPRSRVRRLCVAWTAAAVLSIAWTALPVAPTLRAAPPSPAPSFRLPLLTRTGTIGLAEFTRRPVILWFWAPW